MLPSVRLAAVVALLSVTVAASAASAGADDEAAFRALYRELVETNTTLSVGSCTEAATKMAARLRAAGYADGDIDILAPADRPKDGSLIATLRGRDAKAKPILLLAHIDVVEARREDWQRDPFKLIEENGFFYARGVADDKAMAAVFTDSLIRYKAEGFRPRRGIRLALTCGEETAEVFDSVRWLLQTHPDTLQAAFALNEGASGELDADGRPSVLQIQAGEKVYQDFTLEVTNVGGHSSRPVPDNAIYRLSAGLDRLAAFHFPTRFIPATRAYFEAQTKLVPEASAEAIRAVLAKPDDEAAIAAIWALNPGWNSMLRTTCVATKVEAGHALNALPQRARANVNCRILPGTPISEVQATLERVLGDAQIKLSPAGEAAVIGPPPPLTAAMLEPVRQVAAGIWPSAVLVPTMSTGATDSRFLNAAGIPSYGLSGLFHDAEGSHAHGLDERLRVQSLFDARRFLHEVVKRYAQQRE